jgi:hypothetical protein
VRIPGPIQDSLDWLRFDLPARVDRRLLVGAAVAAAVIVVLALFAILSGGGGKGTTREVTIAVATDNAQQAPVGTLGFPLVATRNTTRISGPDPTADAAAAALATHPPAPSAPPIEAVVLVPDDDWQAGVAASVLEEPAIQFPVLISQDRAIPDPTADALSQLNPQGDVAVYSAGDAAVPSGPRSQELHGDSPADTANSIDQLRQRLTKAEPQHIVIASQDSAAYAMPAASWAARSGDPVLFSGKDKVPDATLAALRRHAASAVYILGPESVISKSAEQAIGRVASTVQRVGAAGAVQNALLFARYSDSSFGWNINDPGHGLVLANTDRPLDAAAAASMSASGKWGPLLLTDTADTLPPELKGFLLDIKPGYESDPTRAVYNHVWLMGDATAIGGQVQAEVDELAELVPIGGAAAGAGGFTDSEPGLAPSRGAEGEPEQAPQTGKKK